MDIILIRHAQAQGGITDRRGLRYAHPDPELSEVGIRMARLLGERLKSYKIEKTYTSDLRRTRQTAEIINEYLHGGIEIRAELREIHMGRFEGKSAEEIERADPAFYAEWQKHLTDLPYPEGESGAVVARRCASVIEEIIGGGLQNVAVVTHGGTIRVLLCKFLGIGFEKRFFLGAPMENCSINLVRFDEEKKVFIIHAVNDTGHLTEPNPLPLP